MVNANTLKNKIKHIRFTFFDILLLFLAFSILFSVYFFLFRTKKDLVVIIKTSEENLIKWPWENTIDKSKTWNSTIWLDNIFYPGMKEKDALGKTAAEVLSVRKYDNRPENPTLYLTLKLKTVYTPGIRIHTYKGKNVLVGSTIQLFLDNVFVESLIVSIDGERDRYPLKKIVVHTQLMDLDTKLAETTGVEPFVVDNVNEGDLVKDSKSRIVLKIIKKDVEEAKKIVTTDIGEVLLKRHPIRKDLYLTLEVLAYKIENRYYFFDSIPLLIGEKIPIHLNHLSIFPVITSIEEIK